MLFNIFKPSLLFKKYFFNILSLIKIFKTKQFKQEVIKQVKGQLVTSDEPVKVQNSEKNPRLRLRPRQTHVLH